MNGLRLSLPSALLGGVIAVAMGACTTREAALISCAPGCLECRFDLDCPPSLVCTGGWCTACEVPLDGSACDGCQTGFEPVFRNGCPTCECALISQCRTRSDCAPEEECFPGQACALTCFDRDPLACCANACGIPGCPFPVPLGCLSDYCPPELMCEGPCMTSHCACDGGLWTCDRACAPRDYPFVCAL